MTATSTPEIQRLLDEAFFVRSLARALARGDAGDVVPGTWLRVVREPFHSGRDRHSRLATAPAS